MKQLPKLKPFEAPEGYFESLPDQIFQKLEPKTDYTWVKWAAAILIFLAVGIYQFYPSSSENNLLALEEEVNLYIDSNYWTAEDLLGMSENPEAILDEILAEEMPYADLLWEDEN
ncbi:hypothetical protein SAMN04488104_103725 [Algoriphagus faecimaris]|uniref:Uncharacterized protein n=2 Tax=Algoriphagus faecimaris TaxID=686796 RepID=A0A1G6VQ86_9BACT|nr:hypothetical protein SAMN04488104_103725 [Algoriphagus faecimaris]